MVRVKGFNTQSGAVRVVDEKEYTFPDEDVALIKWNHPSAPEGGLTILQCKHCSFNHMDPQAMEQHMMLWDHCYGFQGGVNPYSVNTAPKE